MARPSKYRSEAALMLKELLQNEDLAQCFTDQQIFLKLNERLGYDHHICYRTFQRYKAAALLYGEMEVEHQANFDPIYRDLYNAILHSQADQKLLLYKLLKNAEGHDWHHYKWIMERKFPDFNLRASSQKFTDEKELIERHLLEMDMEDAETKMKQEKIEPVTPTAPTEKPIKQQMWERDILHEIEEAIPDIELTAFHIYFAKAQHEWDTKNPLQPGHRFPNAALQDRLVEYYKEVYLNWEKVKGKWLEVQGVA